MEPSYVLYFGIRAVLLIIEFLGLLCGGSCNFVCVFPCNSLLVVIPSYSLIQLLSWARNFLFCVGLATFIISFTKA